MVSNRGRLVGRKPPYKAQEENRSEEKRRHDSVGAPPELHHGPRVCVVASYNVYRRWQEAHCDSIMIAYTENDKLNFMISISGNLLRRHKPDVFMIQSVIFKD